MKKYINISNKGEVDVNAFGLIGASTKVNDNSKIGMFGSGTKYAVAWLIRNNVDFRVFSGKKEIKFSTKQVSMRDADFNQILINGKSTSFTDTMGKDWKAWFAIREVYCNALDEEEPQMKESFDILPKKGYTQIYIEMSTQIQDVINEWDMYFSEKRADVLFKNGEIKLFNGGENQIVYRKGIQCLYGKEERCVFHYDLPNIPINESRVVENIYTLRNEIRDFFVTKATAEEIKYLVSRINGSFEASCSWDYSRSFSKFWLDAFDGHTIVEYELTGFYQAYIDENTIIIPRTLCDALRATYPKQIIHVAGNTGSGGYRIEKTTERQDVMLTKAMVFFKECEYVVSNPINVVSFSSKTTRGMAENGEIYLGQDAFIDGLFTLIMIIIEEQEHLSTGFEDESREFQSHFIKLFLREKEARFSYIL